MMKEKILKKRNRAIVLTATLLCLVIIIGTSFALWNLTFRQTGTNQITTSCFKIDFTEKDDINMIDAYPLNDEEASKLSPYTFKITNICDTSATYQVNLEELEVEGKKLSNQYINLSLNEKVGSVSTFEEVDKTLDNATTSHKLTTGVLKSKEEKSFELRLWLREDSPSNEEIMNASFLSKITVITVYKKNIPEVSSLAYENLDTIKVDVNTISNPDNETLNYYYQLDNNEELKSNTPNYTFPNLQDGTYKIKVRVEDTNGILIYEKEEDVVVAYEHVYISSTGNDTTGNGSPDSPYATLQRAYDKVKSGGEMILLSDITATSTTNMDTANKEVTLKSSNDPSATGYKVFRGNSFKNQILDISNSNIVTTENIMFDGKNLEANGSLIEVHGATLNMNDNTILQNNIHKGKYVSDWKSDSALGGGLYAYDSTINIKKSKIINNVLLYIKSVASSSNTPQGGGIYVHNSTLNLYDGTVISQNISHGSFESQGGGIKANESEVNMYNATINNNKVLSDSNDSRGGGIYLARCTFTMNGGTVTKNQAELGGGIWVSSDSTINLKAGKVEQNTAATGPNIHYE